MLHFEQSFSFQGKFRNFFFYKLPIVRQTRTKIQKLLGNMYFRNHALESWDISPCSEVLFLSVMIAKGMLILTGARMYRELIILLFTSQSSLCRARYADVVRHTYLNTVPVPRIPVSPYARPLCTYTYTSAGEDSPQPFTATLFKTYLIDVQNVVMWDLGAYSCSNCNYGTLLESQ